MYACEYHLRQNLVGAAYADGLALDPAMSLAIRRAQWSAADWAALGRLATTLHAAHMLAWIGQRDELVRRQIEVRRTHRGYPRGNGPAESALQRVEGWIDARRFNFRNARRLKLLLALMRAELAGDADAARYARLIKDAVEAAAGRPSIAWPTRTRAPSRARCPPCWSVPASAPPPLRRAT